MTPDCLEVDVVVIGSGIAGLQAGLHSAKTGARTCILCKGIPARTSASYMAGGLSTTLESSNSQDGPDLHFRDTVIGGAFINDQRLVRILVGEIRHRFADLEQLGVDFDRDRDGRIGQLRRGGHSFARWCTSQGDRGGQAMALALLRAVRQMNVSILSDFLVTEVLLQEGVAVGVLGFDLKRGVPTVVQARSTILATGGAGRVYPRTSMPADSSGDGYHLAFQAGAVLVDMEMVQFHPGGLYLPGMMKGLSTREPAYFAGIGGRLVNALGERFMARYDERLEFATRDVVSRAQYAEVEQGRGGPNGGVYLDLSGLSPQARAELPRTSSRFFDSCMIVGVDPRETDLIEIGPMVHYFMGGVRIDENGATSVPQLYACGEVSGGIHGANRLSGNSLADALVFGYRAGIHAAEAASNPHQPILRSQLQGAEGRFHCDLHGRDVGRSVHPASIESRIRDIMWQQVGVVRNASALTSAVDAIIALRQELTPALSALGMHMRYDRCWISTCEMRALLDVAELIARSALAREESRGAHYRIDWPSTDNASWLASVMVGMIDGVCRVWTEPVELRELRPMDNGGRDQ